MLNGGWLQDKAASQNLVLGFYAVNVICPQCDCSLEQKWWGNCCLLSLTWVGSSARTRGQSQALRKVCSWFWSRANKMNKRWQTVELKKLHNPCIPSVSGDNWMASGFQPRVRQKHLENWYETITLTSLKTHSSHQMQKSQFVHFFLTFSFLFFFGQKLEIVTH